MGSEYHGIPVPKQLTEPGAELLIGQLSVQTGAGGPDGFKIVPVGKNARMQGPLTTPPRSSPVHGTAFLFIIKNAVSVNSLHLHDTAGHPPVFIPHYLPGHSEEGDHSRLVVFVQGDGGLALAAETAPGTGKNILHPIRFLFA
jgi:hypothetical protein